MSRFTRASNWRIMSGAAVLVVPAYAGAVAQAAATHGWVSVSQIVSAYGPHGYCAENHWVVRAHETFLRQGDEKGVAHPNARGHIHNGQAILAALVGDLYPLGLDAAPRAPDEDDRRGRATGLAGSVVQ